MKRRFLEYLGYGVGALLLVRQRPRVEIAAERMAGRGTPVKNRTSPESPADAASPAREAHAPATTPARTRTGPLDLAKRVWNAFSEDECTTLGASVAYFSVFSLAPLLLTVISVAGLVLGREQIQSLVQNQIGSLVGPGAAEQVQSMIARQAENRSGGIIGTVVGLAALLFGATGAFAALQDALNKTWHLKPDPAAGGVRTFLTKRLLSFGMILGVVFLLIASMVVSTAVVAFGDWLGQLLPSALSGWVAHALTISISFAVITVLFAVILKVLPDGTIAWRDAWIGGLATSALFSLGKAAISIYLGKAAPASVYGAAGSLVLIILWLYYASLILLLGSEFTRAWAEVHGRRPEPEPGAVRVVTEVRTE